MKRLHLGTISPNTLPSSTNNATSYSSALAQAAKSLSDCFTNSLMSQQPEPIYKSLFSRLDNLNDSHSQDSGIRSIPTSQEEPTDLMDQSDEFELVLTSDESNQDNLHLSDSDDDSDQFFNLNVSSDEEEQHQDSLSKLDSSCSSNSKLDTSNESCISYSLQTRRCLFTPTPKSGTKTSPRLNTPNKIIQLTQSNNSSSQTAALSSPQQITPVSVFGRSNSIIPPFQMSEQEKEALVEYSIANTAVSSQMSEQARQESHDMIMESLEFECKFKSSNRLIGDRSRGMFLPF